MAQGRREEWREMLLNQGWVIGLMFSESPTTQKQLESFIRTGTPGPPVEIPEERYWPAVHEKVAQILANNGKLIID